MCLVVNPISRRIEFFYTSVLNSLVNDTCRPNEDMTLYSESAVTAVMPANDGNGVSIVDYANTPRCTMTSTAGILKGDFFFPIEYLITLNTTEISRLGITLDELLELGERLDNSEMIMLEQIIINLTEK